MQTSLALAALFGAVMAAPQAGSPSLGAAPEGCSSSYSGLFEITIVIPSGISNKRDLSQRQASTCGQTGILTLNLTDGNLMDVTGKTGYIASANEQFQFDKPVQAGGEYAGQFSVCKNGSLALGPTTNFYNCQSGSFSNLYYANVAPQCQLINIDVVPCAADSSSAASTPTTAVSAAAVSGKPVSVSSDGQPQGTATPTIVPVSVFTDGQPQGTQAPTSVAPVPVSVYTDGQPQATASPTMKSNATVASATAKATIATAGGATVAASFSMAGLMAAFALLF